MTAEETPAEQQQSKDGIDASHSSRAESKCLKREADALPSDGPSLKEARLHEAPGASAASGGDAKGGAVEAPAQPGSAAAADGAADAAPSPRASPPTPVAGASPNALTLTAAYSKDKGCRPTMEDVCVALLDARPGGGAHAACRLSYFAVFDGHGGASCAAYAAEHLHSRVLAAGLASKALGPDGSVDAKAAKAAIAEGYKATDAALLKECAAKNWQDGACCVAVWVLQDTVLVSNVGDAKCVLARLPDKAPPGAAPRAHVLTKEHTALAERARIEKAGGSVVGGRLAGRMQVARSLGDAALKKVGCSSTPDVTAFRLTPRDRFLLLGCDGFWGVTGAQEAVDAAEALLAAPAGPGRPAGAAAGRADGGAKAVTNRLLNLAVREKGCKDNCSVMLVRFGAA